MSTPFGPWFHHLYHGEWDQGHLEPSLRAQPPGQGAGRFSVESHWTVTSAKSQGRSGVQTWAGEERSLTAQTQAQAFGFLALTTRPLVLGSPHPCPHDF